MSFYPRMVNFRHGLRLLAASSLLLLCLAVLPRAYGQSFSFSSPGLQPSSVNPGGSATADFNLTPTGGFTGVVDLTCAVTSSQVTTNLPACLISPSSETPPGTPSLTVTTTDSTTAGTYQIVVTGTSGAIVQAASPLILNVTDLQVNYTIEVSPTTAVPSPVVAGDVATTTVSVASLGSYSGTVTLACLSETPVVTGAPVCSFNPASVTVASGSSGTSTLTLTTFNTNITPVSNSKLLRPRALYALWVSMPALALLGFGSGRRRKLFGIFLLVAIAGALLGSPACSSNTNNATNQITPNDTYTFTVTGSDQKGVGPGSTTAATVTLQVNGPAKQGS